jgi:hypothetical protein
MARGDRRRVAEQAPEDVHGDALARQLGRERVPQHMGRHAALQARASGQAAHLRKIRWLTQCGRFCENKRGFTNRWDEKASLPLGLEPVFASQTSRYCAAGGWPSHGSGRAYAR